MPSAQRRLHRRREPRPGLRVMELEAIEPDLFLEHDPEAGARFAAAVRAALG